MLLYYVLSWDYIYDKSVDFIDPSSDYLFFFVCFNFFLIFALYGSKCSYTRQLRLYFLATSLIIYLDTDTAVTD